MNSCNICHNKTKLIHKDLFDDRYGALGKHSIFRCEYCGFARTIPGIKTDEISSFYSNNYPLAKVTSESIKSSVNKLPNWVLWLLGKDNIAHYYVKPAMKVLDVGCGAGVSLLEIKRMGAIPYGVEPDPNAQKLKRKLNLQIYNGFISDIPASNKFDAVTASQVIEHTDDPVKFLEKARELLNPIGQIILCFPNIDSIYRKFFGKKWLHWHIPYHLNFISSKALEKIANSLNLKIVKKRTITVNLWTIYQLCMVVLKSREGEMSPLWSFQHEKIHKKESIIARLTKYMRRFIVSTAIIMLVPINRIIDILGIGDSMLVVLEKK